MTAGSDSASAVAGGLARHIPVLGGPAVELLNVRPGRCYVDATFGAGGYSREILAAADCRVVAVDRDPAAVAAGADLARAAAGRLVLRQGRFSALETLIEPPIDGIVLDLGVSSMQLDDPGRGFSFRHDGPLDMRMGGEGPSAADIVARISERDLAAVIAVLGEERHARAVARAIVAARAAAQIATTRALAEIVAKVVHTRPGAIHPATRTFQALRIFVNEELDELVAGLAAAERMLAPGGRLVAVAFHSLEDRIVKTFLAERSRAAAGSRHRPEVAAAPATFRLLTRRPIMPDDAEVAANPRARSAKLRAAERCDAPAAAVDSRHLLPKPPSLKLPSLKLPSLAEVLSGGGGRQRGSRR